MFIALTPFVSTPGNSVNLTDNTWNASPTTDADISVLKLVNLSNSLPGMLAALALKKPVVAATDPVLAKSGWGPEANDLVTSLIE